MKSNQKSSKQKGFFAAQAFALQTGQNHGLQLFAPAQFSRPSAKLAMLLQPHMASIVLPVFGRSLSADGKRNKNVFLAC